MMQQGNIPGDSPEAGAVYAIARKGVVRKVETCKTVAHIVAACKVVTYKAAARKVETRIITACKV